MLNYNFNEDKSNIIEYVSTNLNDYDIKYIINNITDEKIKERIIKFTEPPPTPPTAAQPDYDDCDDYDDYGNYDDCYINIYVSLSDVVVNPIFIFVSI